MTTKNLETEEDAKISGDSGQNAGAKNLDEEELAKQIKSQQEYANVFIKSGDFEISMESSESLEVTKKQALDALSKAKAIDNIDDLPTKGVQ